MNNVTNLQTANEHEAAALLKSSVQTMRNNRFLGKGCPYIKIGRSVRYLLSDIQDYLKRNRIDPEKMENA